METNQDTDTINKGDGKSMYLDIGRKHDMEELYKDYKKAGTRKKRDIERQMYNIKSQSKETYQIRENMIRAMRGGDKDALAHYSVKLRAIRREETNNKIQL